jgi:altronate hydrolase
MLDIARRQNARVLCLHGDDNVGVAVGALPAGLRTDGGVLVLEHVPSAHKVALMDITAGEPVRKYGERIGIATVEIPAGAWVHTHNCAVGQTASAHTFGEGARMPRNDGELPSFDGIRRGDGRVGTRNYIAVVSSVNCSSTVARFIADEANRSTLLHAFPHVDGVIPLVHGTGCGLSTCGDGYELLARTVVGYATHPNVGAVIAVGLGCEVLQLDGIRALIGADAAERLRSFTIQDAGGTARAVEQGMAQLRELLPVADAVRREPVPASELVLAVQCGGSDAYSGITANPALGHAVDLLVAAGGTAVLSETPEIYGAEHLLARRAVSRAVGERLLGLITWWEAYTKQHGAVMDNNPSPGNKLGGLTTILEKSLGAVAKGGTSELVAVYAYAERIRDRGLVFMDTPGFDPVSVTGQVAGGATVVCFTTGRGSAFGCKPAPSLKVATTTDLYERMRDDMDVNAGDIVDGTTTIAEKGREIVEELLRVASGKPTKSEQLGYGALEFVPWQMGAVL